MSTVQTFECQNCKGLLEFAPGQNSLTCPYCGTVNALPETAPPTFFEELDFNTALASFETGRETIEVQLLKCPGCQADITLKPEQTTVVAGGATHKAMKPQYLLPFSVDRDQSRSLFRQWLNKRRLAPKELKRRAELAEPVKGFYLPFWTYDAATATNYTGERGEHYQETQTVKDKDGKTSTRTVTKTRWYPARGRVSRFFDDVLIAASKSLPEKLLNRFKSWDLSKMVAAADQYLAGFNAESYTIDIREGLEKAKEVMRRQIEQDVRRDIGGDAQRIHRMDTSYNELTFKYILLPVWAVVYRFNGKFYSVVINGQTGEVQGERPFSAIKIILLVLAIAAAIGAGYLAYRMVSGT